MTSIGSEVCLYCQWETNHIQSLRQAVWGAVYWNNKCVCSIDPAGPSFIIYPKEHTYMWRKKSENMYILLCKGVNFDEGDFLLFHLQICGCMWYWGLNQEYSTSELHPQPYFIFISKQGLTRLMRVSRLAEAVLEPVILLFQPLKYWDYRHVPPCPACLLLVDITEAFFNNQWTKKITLFFLMAAW